MSLQSNFKNVAKIESRRYSFAHLVPDFTCTFMMMGKFPVTVGCLVLASVSVCASEYISN